MSYHECHAEKCGGTHFSLLLTLKPGLGVLRLFLGFSNSLELSREGFALAPSKVYCGLFLIALDCPGLQLLLFDLDLIVKGTSFVWKNHF